MKIRFQNFALLLAALSVGLIAVPLTVAQSSPAAAQAPREITVSSAQPWTDTQLDLHPGDLLQITAAPGKGSCSPDGTKNSPNNNLPLATAAPGALIGTLSADKAAPFVVGSSKELQVDQPGHLYLGMNASGKPLCNGDFSVKLQLTSAPAPSIQSKLAAAAQTWLSGQFGTSPAASTPAQGISGAVPGAPAIAASSATAAPALSISKTALDSKFSKDLDGLPRRVNDQFKNLGDMVNFAIVGSQDQLQSALTAANWRPADTNNEEAVAKAILETYEKKDYLQMPMSTLYLFNRPQDFGYELAQAYSVVASRHHFRVWKAPFTWNGQPVWVGAGTHDIGFEKDQRNGKVTHKIDPAVDGERDNIGETLQKAGKVKSLNYYLPSQPIQEARNATGGSYHSDGRLLVIFLQ
jgi:LssY C-terminus